MNTNTLKLIKMLLEDDNKTPTEPEPNWTFASHHEETLVLVRARNAGVHVGTLEEATRDFVTLSNSNRVWKWEGAFTLSEVSQKGITGGNIACEIPFVSIPTIDVGEIIPLDVTAYESILKHVK
tara:strand:+ start:388 stop:759 length:372 start_codon:yes stop_codon:yes gene_type:complete